MNILTNWLRTYVPHIPADDYQLADDLTLRGIAVEGVRTLPPAADGSTSGHLFEMDITTNRVDAMNHYGIAREAATIYNLPLLPLLPPTENEARHSERTLSERSEASLQPTQEPRPDPERSRGGVEKPASLPQTPVPAPFPVRIEARNLCGRFTAQILRNITIAPSTGDIKTYFEALGHKLISNAVDVSNFVLLGMGHPTHAFDLDKIEGGIVVRLAHKGEKLKLLDGSERTLESDDLVVADENKALALAGVMGGWDSMITAETKNILVEAAWFDQVSIRRSSRRHGLHTDASHRFERGADFNACPTANALVSQLILQHGGHAEGALIDIVIPEIAARTASRPPIQLSVQQVQRHLGTTIAPEGITSEIVQQYLTSLGCQLSATSPGAPSSTTVSSSAKVGNRESDPSFSPSGTDLPSDTTFQVKLPSWRLDLEREIDLIEEVARVYGYNRFANTLPSPLPVIANPTAAAEAAVRNRLLALGYSESISSTFASRHDAEHFDRIAATAPPSTTVSSSAKVGDRESDPSSFGAVTTVTMENPLSEEASLLRPSLIPGMVNMLAHNLNRDVKDVRLFEQGQVFAGTIPPDANFISEVHEAPQLSLGLTGYASATPLHSTADAPFFELKGAIESIVSLFDLASSQSKDPSFRPDPERGRGGVEKPASLPPLSTDPKSALTFSAEAPAWLQPGRAATALLNNQPIARFGELAHTQRETRKLRQPVYLAEIDLAALYNLPLKQVTAHDLSRFQAVERDFSFTFPDTMQWHTIAAAIHALAIPELRRLTPTEIFRDPKGKSVPTAHYALLLKCIFQSNDRTLRDDELTSWWSNIISTLTNLGGVIRAPGHTD
jgi:phenylalanyl-tRNA synthetase beta chain